MCRPRVFVVMPISFHLPMVMLSLPRIFGDAPVAYLTPPSLCATGVGHLDTSDLVWGSGQVIWTCTGMNKTLSPFTSVPVMDEIAGVNTASLGGYLHISKTRASQRPRVRPGEGWTPSGGTLPMTHQIMKTSNHTIPDQQEPRLRRTEIYTCHLRNCFHTYLAYSSA